MLGLAAAAWALLPVLNALTTSTHLGATLPAGDWTWAALDLAFLAAGAVLGAVAWHLHRRRPALQPCQARGLHPRSGAQAPSTGSAGRAQRGLGNHRRNLKPCLPFCFALLPGWPWPWAWTNTTKTPWATRLPARLRHPAQRGLGDLAGIAVAGHAHRLGVPSLLGRHGMGCGPVGGCRGRHRGPTWLPSALRRWAPLARQQGCWRTSGGL